nr:Lon protease [Thaumasiovibrio subtropicus]
MSEVTTLAAIGTVVRIADKVQHSNEGISLDVEGCYKVELLDLTRTNDNLLFAEIRRAANWAPCPISPSSGILASKLEDFLLSVPEIGQHYPAPDFSDATWVVQRWIEILPLDTVHKRMLISQPTSELAQRFLSKLLLSENWI